MKRTFLHKLRTKTLAAAAAVLFSAVAAQALFTQSFDRLIGTGSNGTPALTSCGTTPAIVGTDMAGTVTMGTGTPTGCVITFATPYASAPICVVTWIATPLASQSYATSATAITLTQTATSSNVAKYICVAQPGG